MSRALRLLREAWLACHATDCESIHYLSPIQGLIPGWYIWLDDPGCYELSFLDTQQEGAHEHSRFVLRYFPAIDDPVFDRLAFAEQLVRMSDCFDDRLIEPQEADGCACSGSHCHHHHGRIRGIPKLAKRPSIHPSLYAIGEIGFTFKGDELTEVTLVSHDRLVQRSVTGITVANPGGGLETVVGPGEIDRDLPGWELSKRFFDTFVADVLGRTGVDPVRRYTSRSPGEVFYWSEGGASWSEPSPGVSLVTETVVCRGV